MRVAVYGVLQDGTSGTNQQLLQDLTLVAGDDGTLDLSVTNTAGEVVNLTGYTPVMAVFDPDTGEEIFQRSGTDINASAGTAKFQILRADTFNATPGNYPWQVKLVRSDPQGEFTIVRESTFTIAPHIVDTDDPITPPGPDALLIAVPIPEEGDVGLGPVLTGVNPNTMGWGTAALPNVGPGAGTIGGGSSYINSVTLDAQGRVTAATTGTPSSGGGFYQTVKDSAGSSLPQEDNLQFAARLAVSDASPSTLVDLATVGTAGTYVSITTDAYGRVTAGLAPYTIRVQAGTPDLVIFDLGGNDAAFLNTPLFYVGDTGSAETAFMAPKFSSFLTDQPIQLGEKANNIGCLIFGGSANTLGHNVPNVADDTVALLAATQTLTNKAISGSSNTLSNIGNSSLTNSSITITAGTGLSGGGTVALGGTVTLTSTAGAVDWATLYANSVSSGDFLASYSDETPLGLTTLSSSLGVPDLNTLASIGFAIGSGNGASSKSPALALITGNQAWFLQGNNQSTSTADLVIYSQQNLGTTTEHSRFLHGGGYKVATIGPSSTQQHTLPAVTSDTVALLAATQTFTNKTLTSPVLGGTVTGTYTLGGTPTITAPVINGATSASGNFDLSGSSGTFVTCTGANTLSGNVTVADQKTLSMSYSAVGNAQTVVASLANPTAATSGTTEQWSPMCEFAGKGWDSGASSSKAAKMAWQMEPISQSGNPIPAMLLYSSTNGASYTKAFSFTAASTGTASITGWGSATGQLGQLTFSSQSISMGFNTNNLNPTSDKGSALGASGTKWSTVYAYQHGTATQSTTTSGAVSIDPANGECAQITANGNITGITLSTSSVKDGEVVTLILKQDSGGTSTWPTTITNARLIGGAFTKSSAANAVDSITFRYNGAASKFDQITALCAALA